MAAHHYQPPPLTHHRSQDPDSESVLPPPPQRGLSVRRSLIHERSTYGFDAAASRSSIPDLSEPGTPHSLLRHQDSLASQYSQLSLPKIPLLSASRANPGISRASNKPEIEYTTVPSGDPDDGGYYLYQRRQRKERKERKDRRERDKRRSRSPHKRKSRNLGTAGVGSGEGENKENIMMEGYGNGYEYEEGSGGSRLQGDAAASTAPRFHPATHPDSAFARMKKPLAGTADQGHHYQDDHTDNSVDRGQQPQPQQQEPQREDSENWHGHGLHQNMASAQVGYASEGHVPQEPQYHNDNYSSGQGNTYAQGYVDHQSGSYGGNDYSQEGYAQGPQGQYGEQYDGDHSQQYQQYPPQQQQQYLDSHPLPPPPSMTAPHSQSSLRGPATGAGLVAGAGFGTAAAAAADLLPPNPPHLQAERLQRSSHSSMTDRPIQLDAGGHYTDNPYKRFSTTWDPALATAAGSATALGLDGQIDPDADDGMSDDFGEGRRHSNNHHGGVLGRLGGRLSHNNSGVLAAAGASGAGATAGALAGDENGGNMSDGLLGGANGGSNSVSTTTGLVSNGNRGLGSSGGSGGIAGSAGGFGAEKPEESEWLREQKKGKKKTKWIAAIVALVLILAIAGGVTAGVLVTKGKNGGGSGSGNNERTSRGNSNSGGGSGDDSGSNGSNGSSGGDDSWKEYLNNPALHKVFHGIDYTPLNALYPECLAVPPTQKQVNIDIAIMSQLTNKVRLYGTDCNQAEMVLEAIKTVGADVKIWLGVWVDGNATTNARSFRHMYEILDKWPVDMFEGVVVGNEVLFRQELTESQLSNVLTEVKSNLTGLGIDLPLATSDLGSKWTKDLVTAVDVLMANVHPFFGGVLATDAASWTERYFEEQNKPLAGSKRAMISEVGWPTEGGRRQGSVAGIDELNTFMKDFVCNQNAKGTEYYWFSAFDEPWKIKFNTAEEKWEDKWGLLDAERKVKDGLKIPECK